MSFYVLFRLRPFQSWLSVFLVICFMPLALDQIFFLEGLQCFVFPGCCVVSGQFAAGFSMCSFYCFKCSGDMLHPWP